MLPCAAITKAHAFCEDAVIIRVSPPILQESKESRL